MLKLSATKDIEVRFSEVDSMGVVWHGSYVTYLEDARETFGAKYGLEYITMFNAGFYAPLVDIHLQYKSPLSYGMKARITITLRPTQAAKLIFDYEMVDAHTGDQILTATTTQVFINRHRKLIWTPPEFIEIWKNKYGL